METEALEIQLDQSYNILNCRYQHKKSNCKFIHPCKNRINSKGYE